MFKLMLIAGAGGFIGTCCRFLFNRLFLVYWKAPFPAATFTVNILGCLIFGLITGLLSRHGLLTPKLNALLIVGFCGGFTTFSTFSAEAFSLASGNALFMSFFYVVTSVITGFIAVWLGMMVTR